VAPLKWKDFCPHQQRSGWEVRPPRAQPAAEGLKDATLLLAPLMEPAEEIKPKTKERLK